MKENETARKSVWVPMVFTVVYVLSIFAPIDQLPDGTGKDLLLAGTLVLLVIDVVLWVRYFKK